MKYFNELTRSMEFLAKDPRTVFLGQAVQYPGTAMYNTLKNIKKNKKIELPVAEEMQMGMTIGLAMHGKIPISIYPRWNFLLLACNQLINHLDKISKMSENGFNQTIIIRTAIGSERPLHPQDQHVGDFTEEFRKMCKNINFYKLKEPKDIFKIYQKSLKSQKPSVIVEYGDFYNEK